MIWLIAIAAFVAGFYVATEVSRQIWNKKMAAIQHQIDILNKNFSDYLESIGKKVG